METKHYSKKIGELHLISTVKNKGEHTTSASVAVRRNERDVVTANRVLIFKSRVFETEETWSISTKGEVTTIEDFKINVCAYDMILKEIERIDKLD